MAVPELEQGPSQTPLLTGAFTVGSLASTVLRGKNLFSYGSLN